MLIIIKIILYEEPFTECIVTGDNVMLPSQQHWKLIGVKDSFDCLEENAAEFVHKSRGLRLITNSLFLQPFINCLYSYEFRTKFLIKINKRSHSLNGAVPLKLILEPPDKEIIDYSWNYKLLKLVWTKVEIENAFSWLSTLGGAYSALGDYFEHCAEEAGRISIRQYKLSKMLGDEGLAARSQLYSALAFAQKGYLKISRRIVRKVNEFSFETKDKRLNRMCQGVWTKLRYMRSLVVQGKCSGDYITVNSTIK